MNEILVVLPSRERPKECLKMIKSVRKTQEEEVHISLILDSDEPHTIEYLDTCSGLVDQYAIRERISVTKHINDCYQENRGKYRYYHLSNDDVIYHTQGWDVKLKEPLINKYGGVSFGDDGFQTGNLATFPLINCEIVDALGWLQQPTLNRFYGDTIWSELAHHEDALFKVNAVKIEHFHKYRSMSGDAIVKDLQANPVYQADKISYFKWLTSNRYNDYVTFRKALKKPKIYQSNPAMTLEANLKQDAITGEI